MIRVHLAIVLASLIVASPSAGAETFGGGTLKVLSSGSAPRHALRFRLRAGQSEKLEIVLRMDMQIDGMAAKQTTPAIVQTMRLEVDRVLANGDVHLSFEFLGAKLRNTGGHPAAVLDQMRAQLKKMVGYRGRAVMTSRGHILSMQSQYPPGMDAATKKTLQSTEQAMRQISPPLPSQRVGVGARWIHKAQIQQSGIRIDQQATYRLVSVRKKRVTLAVSIKQAAPAQTINQDGMSMRLDRLRSSGQGTVTLQLHKLVPRSNVGMQSRMTIDALGRKMTLTTGVNVSMSRTR